MEVIKNNCLNTTEKQNLENIEVTCENCGSILEVNNKHWTTNSKHMTVNNKH